MKLAPVLSLILPVPYRENIHYLFIGRLCLSRSTFHFSHIHIYINIIIWLLTELGKKNNSLEEHSL